MFFLLQLGAIVIGIIPERCLLSFAKRLGHFFYFTLGLRRKVVDEALDRAFGRTMSTAERQNIAVASYTSAVLTILEFIYSTRHDPATTTTLDNAEQAKALIAKGQGAYFFGIHMSNFEAMGATVNSLLAPAHTVVKRVGPPLINNTVQKIRDKNKFRTIAKGKKGVAFRAMLEALQRGETVGYVADQARAGEPRLDFFGVPALTNTTLGRLWTRHPAPIIPIMTIRTGFARYTLKVFPAWELPYSKEDCAQRERHEEIAAEITRRINPCIEMLIKVCPEQYFWFHRRWK